MAEVINLRQVRKNKKRDEKEKAASANRQKFGQTKSVKKQHEMQRKIDGKRLDDQKLDKD